VLLFIELVFLLFKACLFFQKVRQVIVTISVIPADSEYTLFTCTETWLCLRLFHNNETYQAMDVVGMMKKICV
jgi:predicted transcriptional regulator